MLEGSVHMGVHCLQMMGRRQLATLDSMITSGGTKVIEPGDYGIAVIKLGRLPSYFDFFHLVTRPVRRSRSVQRA